MNLSYPVPSQTLETTYEIKRSLFHARAGYADSKTMVHTFLESCRQDYPDARHHCWAYLIGNPISPDSGGMSDDGEPSGTAGKPIMNILQHKNIGDVVVVVSRYFGGTKLGAGGLVRAYSSATQQTIEKLVMTEQISLSRFEIMTDFKYEQEFRYFVESRNGEILDYSYNYQVRLLVSLPTEHIEPLKTRVASLQQQLREVLE